MDPIELSEPLEIEVQAPCTTEGERPGPVITFDVIDVYNEICSIQKVIGKDQTGNRQIQAMVAIKMGIDVDEIAMNQVFEFVAMIQGIYEKDKKERKKKVDSIVASHCCTQESHQTSGNGTSEKKTSGSEITDTPAPCDP